jgi:hypothetical protein
MVLNICDPTKTPTTPNRLLKDLKKIRPVDSAVEEAKDLELSSLEQGSLHLSHALATRADGKATEDLTTGSGRASGWSSSHDATRDDDSVASSSDSSSDFDAPFTFEELQERTQAARAAVNILLPNRTDDMAGRDGPYAMRRREQGRGRR